MADLKVKVAIPRLTFKKNDDVFKKNKLVINWKNKLTAYAQIHNLKSFLFNAQIIPSKPPGRRCGDLEEFTRRNPQIDALQVEEDFENHQELWSDYDLRIKNFTDNQYLAIHEF